ncbi:MAG: gamma-glutamylcyclotransferase family protein [Cyanobacteria bacterium J06581_3]
MLYAAYGSNLHPFRLQARTPSARLLGTGAIAHHTLRFHKRGYRDFSGKCNLISQYNNTAYVAVYDIPSHEMSLLDKAEGAGAGYDRKTIAVDGFGDCIIYLAAAAHIDDSLLPFCWYKALVVAGCEQLGFPDSYVEAVRTVKAVRDLEGDRRNLHMALVEECQSWSRSSKKML